jgi:multiple sugar transport system ATP-binding protein
VFVATFIGSPAMNLYEAGLSADGAGSRPTVVLGSQRLDLPAQVAARVAAYQGRKVIVGIRPEDLVVSAGPGLVTEARLVEVLGSEQHVYFWLDATPAAQAAAAAVADESAEAGFLVGSAPNGMARVDPHTPVKPGGRVTFTVDPERLYFFDPDTGQAITG